MRRTVQYSLVALAIAGIVMAIALAVAWPASYTRLRGAVLYPADREVGVAVLNGGVYVLVGTGLRPFANDRFEWVDMPLIRPSPMTDVECLGFGYGTDGSERFVRLPVPAVIIALLATAAALWLAAGRLARGGRAAAGRCAACGYDLRATPDRCPECGMAAARRAT